MYGTTSRQANNTAVPYNVPTYCQSVSLDWIISLFRSASGWIIVC